MHSIRSGCRIGTSYWWKHWLSPRTYTSWVKWYYQRATRGWADCDVWSLDDYLNDWLPDALRQLKADKHGIPGMIFEDGDMSPEDGSISDPAMDAAEKRWNAILDSMIVGFEANKRRMDGLYEDELGPYPLGDFADHGYISHPDASARLAASKPLEERDDKLFEEGMKNFAKYYNTLWD